MWRMNRHDNDNSPCLRRRCQPKLDIAWATTTSATSCTVLWYPKSGLLRPSRLLRAGSSQRTGLRGDVQHQRLRGRALFQGVDHVSVGPRAPPDDGPGPELQDPRLRKLRLVEPADVQGVHPPRRICGATRRSPRGSSTWSGWSEGRNYTPNPINSIYPTGASGASHKLRLQPAYAGPGTPEDLCLRLRVWTENRQRPGGLPPFV